MAESFLEEVIRYVRFEGEHQAALQAFHQIAEPHFPDLARRFYERLHEHERARAVFKSQAQIDRLQVSMQAWLSRLLAGPWDESYFELRARIGTRHVKVGLPQRYMLTAMNQIRDMLRDIAERHYGDSPERRAVEVAVDKICDVELAIMLETYRDDSIEAVTRVQKLERDLLQRRLQITEARYQAIIETAEVLVIAADPAGHVVLFNRKAEATVGISRSEVVGTDVLRDLFPPPDYQRFLAALSAALAGESPPPFVATMFTRDDRERWIRWHVTTLAASGDPFVCAIGIDQTEERALETQSRHAEHLAALGTLAAGLAHEIRNPLNAAQLQLLLVERRVGKMNDPNTKSTLEAASTVRIELSRLGALVEDFLAFARPTRLRLAGGDLVSTVNGVVRLLEPDMDTAQVRIELDAPETLAARYDDERIRQVLHNLIRNGMEAAGPGGRVAVQVLRDRNRAVIEIRDDGPGPPSGMDLFEPFQTSKDSGTGLGLSIVHRIISDHAGVVSYERNPPWTVFRVELPIDGPDGGAVDNQTVRVSS